MEIYHRASSPTSFLPYPQQDDFTQLTHDLSHKLSLHLPPPEDPSHEVPLSEDHVEEHQPQSQDVARGNEAGELEEEEEEKGRGGVPEDGDGDGDGDSDGDDDFSFCCERLDGSPVSAEDVFVDGRIRPAFPLFNQSLLLCGEPRATYPLQLPLRRLFAEDAGECPRVVEEIELPSPGSCKKSNSTGSSKLCRFMDSAVTRSTSDGKDAFVFLRKDKDKGVVASDKIVGKEKMKGKGKGRKPLPYAAGKGKATEKHRSYLPYRRDLLGFFTNSNLLSKNVHPF